MRLHSSNHAASIVGAFYEKLTTRILSGCLNDKTAEDCRGDITTDDGRLVEVKSSSRARWLIRPDQLETLVGSPGSLFVFWRYRYSKRKLLRHARTIPQLHAYLARSTMMVYVVPTPFVSQWVDTVKVHGLFHGTYLQVKMTRIDQQLPTAVVSKSKRHRVNGERVRPFSIVRFHHQDTAVVPPF